MPDVVDTELAANLDRNRPGNTGWTSPTPTALRYGHLWPDSEDETRVAVDAVLGHLAAASA